MKILTSVLLATGVLFAQSSYADYIFKLEKIGVNYTPHGINNSGVIVGSHENYRIPYEGNDFRGESRAAIRDSSGRWRYLFGKKVRSVAYSIDNDGRISGALLDNLGDNFSATGFYLSSAGALYLMPKSASTRITNRAGWKVKDGVVFGTTTNDIGQVAARWKPESGQIDYFFGPYRNTGLYLGSSGFAGDSSGRVVGGRTTGGILATRPASWESWEFSCTDGELGSCALPQTFPGNVILGIAKDTNDSGQTVGYERDILDSGVVRGVFWEGFGDSFSASDMGSFGFGETYPWAINSSGSVVGESKCASYWEGCAFIWSKSGGIVDLNNVTDRGSYHIVRATAINDLGQIVGTAIKTGINKTFAVLLTPIGSGTVGHNFDSHGR